MREMPKHRASECSDERQSGASQPCCAHVRSNAFMTRMCVPTEAAWPSAGANRRKSTGAHRCVPHRSACVTRRLCWLPSASQGQDARRTAERVRCRTPVCAARSPPPTRTLRPAVAQLHERHRLAVNAPQRCTQIRSRKFRPTVTATGKAVTECVLVCVRPLSHHRPWCPPPPRDVLIPTALLRHRGSQATKRTCFSGDAAGTARKKKPTGLEKSHKVCARARPRAASGARGPSRAAYCGTNCGGQAETRASTRRSRL